MIMYKVYYNDPVKLIEQVAVEHVTDTNVWVLNDKDKSKKIRRFTADYSYVSDMRDAIIDLRRELVERMERLELEAETIENKLDRLNEYVS